MGIGAFRCRGNKINPPRSSSKEDRRKKPSVPMTTAATSVDRYFRYIRTSTPPPSSLRSLPQTQLVQAKPAARHYHRHANCLMPTPQACSLYLDAYPPSSSPSRSNAPSPMGARSNHAHGRRKPGGCDVGGRGSSLLAGSSGRRSATPRTVSPVPSNPDMIVAENTNPDFIRGYLEDNPDFLDEYVVNHIEIELMERWLIRKTQRLKNSEIPNARPPSGGCRGSDGQVCTANSNSVSTAPNGKITRKTSLSRWKFCVHADKRKMLQELTHSMQLKPSKAYVLWELANCISSAVSADGFNLYVVDKNTQSISHFDKETDELDLGTSFTEPVQTGTTIAAYVAHTRESIRIVAQLAHKDPRFPRGVAVNADKAKVIMCQPIVQSDAELLGVLELFRHQANGVFHEEDEEIGNSYLVWGGIALHYAEMYYHMVKQRKLNDFLLTVVKSIFQDMVSMDTLITKIMNFAQKLVNADRASLFLVDHRAKELYARIFDMGGLDQIGNGTVNSPTEIRFPIGTGIAGQVAMTGENLNISDAYSDPRFNRNVDNQTGYHTKTILCMPIFIRGSVIGVVQMVNKQNGVFTKADEESFEVFASYCGLALHHAKLYDKIQRSEKKYKVALEVLSYHSTCTDDEVAEIMQTEKTGAPVNALGVDDYYFACFALESDEKVRIAIHMFQDLFGLVRFDKDCLIKFTLTVRKNYRRVPYHNWTHGFTVANSMYAILKSVKGTFRPLEALSLYISCLCHDLDHRGKTNKFMLDTASPLAAMYTTSTLEHHHFNQTVSILQHENHNIFKSLSSEEYKQVLGNIKHCILATDLAVFFANKAKLKTIVEAKTFDWENNEHRLLLQAISMTACDLCASCKPWEQQVETVRVIFEEFYDQGDLERQAGREPIPMMDRTKAHEQPQAQVGFLEGICIPCYDLLYSLLPTTKPLLEGCTANLNNWKTLVEEIKRKRET